MIYFTHRSIPVTKSTAKIAKPDIPADDKRLDFDRRLKLVKGKLDDLSSHSDEKLTLLRGDAVVWRSEKKKPAKKPAKKKSAGAGRPNKKKTKTSVDELQAMREAKALRIKEMLQSKKKPSRPKKPAAEKTAPAPFTVSRERPPVKRKKRA
jgi:hypothetical protein